MVLGTNIFATSLVNRRSWEDGKPTSIGLYPSIQIKTQVEELQLQVEQLQDEIEKARNSEPGEVEIKHEVFVTAFLEGMRSGTCNSMASALEQEWLTRITILSTKSRH